MVSVDIEKREDGVAVLWCRKCLDLTHHIKQGSRRRNGGWTEYQCERCGRSKSTNDSAGDPELKGRPLGRTRIYDKRRVKLSDCCNAPIERLREGYGYCLECGVEMITEEERSV